MANVEKISVSLPRDMIDDIRDAVESGAYATTSEVLRDAVRGWQKTRAEPLARITPKSLSDLKRMIQEGVDSAKRGKVKPAEEVFARLEAKYAAMARKQGVARKSRP
jgi:antitoxin ParD1/3/4